jgi:cytochrome c peroxidase
MNAGLAVLLALGAASTFAATQTASSSFSERDRRRIATHSPLPPPPASPTNARADDERAAEFGRRLFFDTRFSSNGAVSCATCHAPELGFADGKQVAETLGRSERHSLSLWNVAHQRWFFWDGRADSLWAQAVQPLENELEMGGDRVALVHALASDAALKASYEELFGELPNTSEWPAHAKPMPQKPADVRNVAWNAMGAESQRAASRVAANFGKALEAYERRLVRGASPFDRFAQALAEGDPKASELLSPVARRGLALFLGKGNCRSCHGGPNFSDGEFHNIGVPPLDGGKPTDAARFEGARAVLTDPFNAKSEFSDARRGEAALKLETLELSPQSFGEFRTPSLRNVALAPPFMHQGQFATLRDVLRFYSTLDGATQVGHHQEQTLQPLKLSEPEIDELVAFLEALTGDPPSERWLTPP